LGGFVFDPKSFVIGFPNREERYPLSRIQLQRYFTLAPASAAIKFGVI